MIYLDNAASSPLKKKVMDELAFSFQNDFANPAALHLLGKKQLESIKKIKLHFLKSFHAKLRNDHGHDQFIFTSSATESNTTIIKGLSLSREDLVLYSEADHPSLVENVYHLKKRGINILSMELGDEGIVNLDWLKSQFQNTKNKIKLLAISHINNHNGAIQPLSEISKIINLSHDRTHFHVDAVQSYGLFNIDVEKENIDSLTISSHKISGPKGIAGLYLSFTSNFSPLLLGGGHQGGNRASTEATPLIKAFDIARNEVFTEDLSQYYEFNKFLRNKLSKLSPLIEFPYGESTTSPKILTMMVRGISSDILLRHLEEEDIFISSSSACSSRLKGVSPVFTALNLPEKDHKYILRLSFGWQTTLDELDEFCHKFEEILSDLEFLIGQ